MHMYATVLSIHIALAVVMTISTLTVFVAGWRQSESKTYIAMLVSFAATVLSGVGLVAVGGSLTHLCVTMTVFGGASVLAARYYKRRMALVGVATK